MNENTYEKLKKCYPPVVSSNQLYVICRIAKRSAKYLLDNKIIPCTDTGKKTRRYKIHLDDIIKYLQDREIYGSRIPRRSTKKPGLSSAQQSLISIISKSNMKEVEEYFGFIYSDCADLIKTKDVVEMTGLSAKTIHEKIKAGRLKVLHVGNGYVIPLQWFLDFVKSPAFIEARSDSAVFRKIIRGFERWKAVKS